MSDEVTVKNPRVRFLESDYLALIERAEALSSERGLSALPLTQYLLEASKFFEDHRPKQTKGGR